MRRKEMEKFDVTKYVGVKTKIETAEVIDTKFGIALKVLTEPIPFKDGDSLSEGKELRASSMFSFSKDDEGYYLGIDSKLDKFCKSHGIDTDILPDTLEAGVFFENFTGVEVTLQKNAKTEFLEVI